MNRCWKDDLLTLAALLAASLGTSLLVMALWLVSGAAWAAGEAAATSPVGEWWTPGFGARVRIEPCGDALCGRIVWVWDEAAAAADKAPLVGREVVARMRPQGGLRWAEGRLHDPEAGRDYSGSLHLASPGRLVLEGCVLVVCRQQVWRRVDSARCPPVEPATAARL
jgi:uncharacterized protein (DUF2147 family)